MQNVKTTNFGLEGKVIVLTGGTKGLGHILSKGIAAAGAKVVVISRNEADCKRVASEINCLGQEAYGIAADVSNSESITTAIQKILDIYGCIDVLINNAGVTNRKKFELLTEEDWDYVININLKGAFLTAQTVGKQMIKQKNGVILNMASVLGLVGQYFVAPYCASKGGIVQLTKALALEWAIHNIRVNAVAPSYIMTELTQDALTEEKAYNYILSQTPMRRLGQPEEIVGTVLFLASDHASYITGQVICVDGGWTAQ